MIFFLFFRHIADETIVRLTDEATMRRMSQKDHADPELNRSRPVVGSFFMSKFVHRVIIFFQILSISYLNIENPKEKGV